MIFSDFWSKLSDEESLKTDFMKDYKRRVVLSMQVTMHSLPKILDLILIFSIVAIITITWEQWFIFHIFLSESKEVG